MSDNVKRSRDHLEQPEHFDLEIRYSQTAIAQDHRALDALIRRCAAHETSLDVGTYSPDAIRRAREFWRVRMVAEHQSTAVFAGLAAQMMDAGASMDMKFVVLRMGQDELRHAEICGQVLRALGDEARCTDVPLVRAQTAHRRCSPEERALRNMIYGCCMTETVNAARLVDALETTLDPCCREATRQLVADEAAHARFGFQYLEDWGEWLRRHDQVRISIARYLRYAWAVLERDRSGKGGEDRVVTADELALGVLKPRRLVELFYETVEAAVIPGLEQFGIDASAAWKARSLDPAVVHAD